MSRRSSTARVGYRKLREGSVRCGRGCSRGKSTIAVTMVHIRQRPPRGARSVGAGGEQAIFDRSGRVPQIAGGKRSMWLRLQPQKTHERRCDGSHSGAAAKRDKELRSVR